MANVYVDSNAAGAGTGANWANAYTTLAAALTAKAAGDDFWVAHNHAETQASGMTLTAPGTAASPNRVICVSSAGTVPPVSADLRATATITTTAGSFLNLSAGYVYFYGIIFNCATGAVTNGMGLTAEFLHFENCSLKLNGTGAQSFTLGTGSNNTPAKLDLVNTPLTFGATTQFLQPKGTHFHWRNTATAINGSLPTTLFAAGNLTGGALLIEGVDLSALGSGKTLVGAITAPHNLTFKDCKLGASVTVATTPTAPGGARVSVIRCDSGDTNYRTEKYDYTGTQTTETTIVRTGGASDGTTPIAWKLVTTANSKRYMPFEALPIAIWNETTGSAITLTIEGIWGSGAVPTNANLWMDVEYLGTSGVPLGLFATSGPADQLAAGTNLTSSSETWGGSTTKFKMSVTVTPQEKGPITIYVKAALLSSTFYIDPKVTVS